MKIQSLVALALALVALVAITSAFSPQKQAFTKHTSSLQAKKDWWSPGLTAAVGWTLALQIASASTCMPSEQLTTPQEISTPPTLLLSIRGKISEWFKEEEKSYEKIDFNMPSYDSKFVGFKEQQQESVTEIKGAATQADLQAETEAMEKAEAARQAKLQEKMEAMKRRAEEAKKQNAK
jgi:hypothetical protein